MRLVRTSSSTIGIASAISAVATTKIRNTSTAPTVVAVCWAKVTRLRLTPLSISSMHISITSTLRRTITPSRPSEKSATARPSSSWVLSMRPRVAGLRPTRITASAATTAATSSTEVSSKSSQ